MNIIGINGYKHSGKNETAKAIEKLYTGNIKLVAFADKLKIVAARSLGYTDIDDQECVELMDDFKENASIDVYNEDFNFNYNNLTVREFLQNLGTEGARKVFGGDFWVDQVLPIDAYELNLMYRNVDLLVITDVRFIEEVARIKYHDGIVWEVLRPGVKSDGHTSEQPLPRTLIDYQIENKGDLACLRGAASLGLQRTL